MAGNLKAKVIVCTGTAQDMRDLREEFETEINAFLEKHAGAEIVATNLESDLILPNSAAMAVIYYRDKK